MTTPAAAAQLAANAAILPAAQAILTALEAMDAALAQAQGVIAGCTPCRTVNLVNNVMAMRTSYGAEATGCISDLTPPTS